MNAATTMKWNVRFSAVTKGRKTLGLFKDEPPCSEQGRVPRAARLMALAIKFEGMIREGVVKDYSELARLGNAGADCQIMELTSLAPDIQEAILHLPRVQQGREPIEMRQLLPIAVAPSWADQRRAWESLQAKRASQ